jgi:hypothetical protein
VSAPDPYAPWNRAPYGPGPPPTGPNSNALGAWALGLGISSIVLGLFTSIPAIVLGLKGRRKARAGLATNGAMATTGLAFGAVMTVINLLVIAFLAAALARTLGSFFSPPVSPASLEQGRTEAERLVTELRQVEGVATVVLVYSDPPHDEASLTGIVGLAGDASPDAAVAAVERLAWLSNTPDLATVDLILRQNGAETPRPIDLDSEAKRLERSYGPRGDQEPVG